MSGCGVFVAPIEVERIEHRRRGERVGGPHVADQAGETVDRTDPAGVVQLCGEQLSSGDVLDGVDVDVDPRHVVHRELLTQALFAAPDRLGEAQLKTGTLRVHSRWCRTGTRRVLLDEMLPESTVPRRRGRSLPSLCGQVRASNRYASATLSRGSPVANWVSKGRDIERMPPPTRATAPEAPCADSSN